MHTKVPPSKSDPPGSAKEGPPRPECNLRVASRARREWFLLVHTVTIMGKIRLHIHLVGIGWNCRWNKSAFSYSGWHYLITDIVVHQGKL
jgi:hypothetical protein